MVVVDTNILVYAADAASDEHERCRSYLERLRHGATAWFLTWSISYEFARVVTHPRVFRRPWRVGAAWGFIEALIASPSCSVLLPTDRHTAVGRELFDDYPDVRGNLVHDAHTVVLMREHGVRRVCTRDTDFHRFDVEVVGPTEA